MIIGGATVVVVESRNGGMNCEAHPNKLQAVLAMMNRGDIGGGAAYGCVEHKAAIARIEEHIEMVKATIAEAEAYESRVEVPPCLECGAMTEQEAQDKCKCGGDRDDCHGTRLWPT